MPPHARFKTSDSTRHIIEEQPLNVVAAMRRSRKRVPLSRPPKKSSSIAPAAPICLDMDVLSENVDEVLLEQTSQTDATTTVQDELPPRVVEIRNWLVEKGASTDIVAYTVKAALKFEFCLRDLYLAATFGDKKDRLEGRRSSSSRPVVAESTSISPSISDEAESLLADTPPRRLRKRTIKSPVMKLRIPSVISKKEQQASSQSCPPGPRSSIPDIFGSLESARLDDVSIKSSIALTEESRCGWDDPVQGHCGSDREDTDLSRREDPPLATLSSANSLSPIKLPMATTLKRKVHCDLLHTKPVPNLPPSLPTLPAVPSSFIQYRSSSGTPDSAGVSGTTGSTPSMDINSRMPVQYGPGSRQTSCWSTSYPTRTGPSWWVAGSRPSIPTCNGASHVAPPHVVIGKAKEHICSRSSVGESPPTIAAPAFRRVPAPSLPMTITNCSSSCDKLGSPFHRAGSFNGPKTVIFPIVSSQNNTVSSLGSWQQMESSVRSVRSIRREGSEYRTTVNEGTAPDLSFSVLPRRILEDGSPSKKVSEPLPSYSRMQCTYISGSGPGSPMNCGDSVRCFQCISTGLRPGPEATTQFPSYAATWKQGALVRSGSFQGATPTSSAKNSLCLGSPTAQTSSMVLVDKEVLKDVITVLKKSSKILATSSISDYSATLENDIKTSLTRLEALTSSPARTTSSNVSTAASEARLSGRFKPPQYDPLSGKKIPCLGTKFCGYF